MYAALAMYMTSRYGAASATASRTTMKPTTSTDEQRLRSALTEALPGVRWSTDLNVAADGADLIVTLANRERILIDIKRRNQPRYEEIEGALAHSYLRLRAEASDQDHILVAVSVPRLTVGIQCTVEAFARRYMAHAGWMVMGDGGDYRIVLPTLRIDLSGEGDNLPVPQRQSAGQTRQLFTPNNQYLAKSLLLQDKDKRYWRPQGSPPYRSTLELARSLGVVSESGAYRFSRVFRAAGYLATENRRLVIARPAALVETWLDFAATVRPELYPMRSLYGDPMDDLVSFNELARQAGYFLVVGGFAACQLNGWLHTPAAALEVHVGPQEDLRQFADRLDLEPCHPDAATLTLIRTPATVHGADADALPGLSGPASIWNCALWPDGHGGVWVADALQAALDCVRHSARGREQADFLVGEVLGLAGGPA